MESPNTRFLIQVRSNEPEIHDELVEWRTTGHYIMDLAGKECEFDW